MNTKKRLFEKEESHQAMMQLKSILANAQSLLDQVEVFEEGLDAWVQSYLTKSDDYLEAIKKYITYGRETTLTPAQTAPAGAGAPPMPGAAAEPMMPSINDFHPEMMAEPATELTAQPEGPEGPEEPAGPEMEGPEVEEPVEEPEEGEPMEDEPEMDPEEIEEEPEEGEEEMGEPMEGPETSSRAQLVGGGDAMVGPEDMDGDDDDAEIPPMDLMNQRKGEEDEMTDDDLDQMNAETDVVDPDEDDEEFAGIEDADTTAEEE